MKRAHITKICAIICLLTITGCVKDSQKYDKITSKADAFELKPYEKILLEKEAKTIPKNNQTPHAANANNNLYHKIGKELDFTVQNMTGKTIYVACFSYIKKMFFTRWRWDKSPVYKLEPGESVTIDIDTIPDEQWYHNVFGALAVFHSKKKAEDVTYELLDDDKRIDLDKLYKITESNEKVIIRVEKYGFKGDLRNFDIVPEDYEMTTYQELDFVLENQTGKPVYVTCFVYQIDDDVAVWRYDKTEVQKLDPGQETIIDVDTIVESYNRVYTRATLGIFDEDELDEAKNATYELLKPKNKLEIGRLVALKNKKVVLDIEKYGYVGDFIEFSFQPLRKEHFKKVHI